MSNDLAVFESLVKLANQRESAEGMLLVNDNELTIRGLLLMLERRRALILWTVAVCFLVAVTLCIFLKPRYEALGEIQVQKSATDGLGLENLTGSKQEGVADALDENIDLQTQANILQSYSLALRVIDDLNLEKTEDFKPTFNPVGWLLDRFTKEGAQDPPTAALDDAPHRRDHAVRVFQRHLKIDPQSGTRLIDIKYRSTDPKIAAAVVNDLAKSLV